MHAQLLTSMTSSTLARFETRIGDAVESSCTPLVLSRLILTGGGELGPGVTVRLVTLVAGGCPSESPEFNTVERR